MSEVLRKVTLGRQVGRASGFFQVSGEFHVGGADVWRVGCEKATEEAGR